ncbi:MAG: radical SAM protein [Planctomycetota bacterium]|nr:radical SAM protein [Planctomycetota bacterium]
MIQRQNFPVTLVFPPQGHFTQPYLALPCLKGWLRSHGFEDVELLDANIEAYDAFLDGAYIERCAERVAQRLPLERFAARKTLGFRDLAAFRAASECAASAAAVAARIDDAKAVMRGGAFFDSERYVPAVRTIYHALRIVSAAHFPSELTPHNFTMRYGNDRSAEVLAATLDEDENPFIAFYRERVLPRLVARKPRVLGLSIIYGSQLVPALTLARLVKAALPDCHITAGGGFLAYIGQKLMNAPGVDGCLDSLVFHEGEAPLLALCEALRDGRPLGTIGSLSWFDRSSGHARLVENERGHPIKLDDAPAPDFEGLPFHLYLSPEIVVPYDVNRGCYYGECTFCTLPTVIGPGYRTRSAKTIVDHVIQLRDKLGTSHVNFITDCMPPGLLRDLPEELIARRAGIHWWADARVEPKAYTKEGCERLVESGCRKLLFGFETATPRLLKLMKKGQSLKSVVDVARNCSEAGISVTFFAMVGFPSETKAEAQATVDFLVEHADIVREVSLQTFHIDEENHVFRNPAEFSVRIRSDPTADLQLYHDYEAEVGMTQGEAAEMFERMMAALRARYPLFSGDNIFWFMQKSHYFLHLARGTSPDEFVARCQRRAALRADDRPHPTLDVGAGLTSVAIPFSWAEAVAGLGTAEARAARPEFLTGRYVADAEEEAAAHLKPLEPTERALIYCGETAEFAEVRPDGARALAALRRAGSVGALAGTLPPGAARENLERFAGELARRGILVRREEPSLTSVRGTR